MPKGGQRYRLMLYTYLLNRWWRGTMILAFALLILAGGLHLIPQVLPEYSFPVVAEWRLWVVGGSGALSLLVTFFLAIIRNSAYVQPYERHVRLVTPFLRLNISYQRFRQTYTDEFKHLFPPERSPGWKRELIEPLAGRTVLVVELNEFPVPRWSLMMFLSPFFFPDRSARLALLVEDWMGLSTEMDSVRGKYLVPQRPTQVRTSYSDLLGGDQNRSG